MRRNREQAELELNRLLDRYGVNRELDLHPVRELALLAVVAGENRLAAELVELVAADQELNYEVDESELEPGQDPASIPPRKRRKR